MNGTERLKEFEDPLFAPLNKQAKGRTRSAEQSEPRTGNRKLWLFLTVLLAAALGALGYFLLQANQKIEELSSTLVVNQNQLAGVSEKLEDSEKVLQALDQTLNESRSQLTTQGRELNRYRSLYTELQTGQKQQTRELEAIAIQKADQSEVEVLRSRAEELDTRVTQTASQTNTAIADLRDLSTRNRTDLERGQEELVAVQSQVEELGTGLKEVQKSLEREYYNFELREKGGIMKVFNVALNLRKTDFSRQRFNLDIIAGTHRIRKNGQAINEPIYFYVEGTAQPYEILVSRIERNFVVGYLSIPKS